MATTPTKPTIEVDARLADPRLPHGRWSAVELIPCKTFIIAPPPTGIILPPMSGGHGRSGLTRCRRCWHSRHCISKCGSGGRWLLSIRDLTAFPTPAEFEETEQFVLDEVLQLVAERAIAITGADGLGIALAENNEIVLRASAGAMKPDVGARIQRDSAFSGACFRTAQIIRCDDTEMDERVNLAACRRLGARSMVAVPLCGRRRVIGVLEAFSGEPFGFNDSDVTNLELLAELILGALKPEDEDRFAESAQVAEAQLAPAAVPTQAASSG